MINKVIHSFNAIQVQHLFDDFTFIKWEEKDVDHLIKTNYSDKISYFKNISFWLKSDFVKTLILHRFGGIFINPNLEVQKNFYDKLDPLRLNILERYENNQIFIDDSMVACENNLNGMNYILDKMINNSLYEKIDKHNYKNYGFAEICKELFLKERESFNVLPHTQFNVKKSNVELFNKQTIYILNAA